MKLLEEGVSKEAFKRSPQGGVPRGSAVNLGKFCGGGDLTAGGSPQVDPQRDIQEDLNGVSRRFLRGSSQGREGYICIKLASWANLGRFPISDARDNLDWSDFQSQCQSDLRSHAL